MMSLSFGSLQFASAWVLICLLLLPVWWIIRRRKRPAAIVFSRVGVLKAGPRAGRRTTLILFILRNLLLASTIVALSRPRSGAHAEDQTSEGINIVADASYWNTDKKRIGRGIPRDDRQDIAK